ncbi:MAG: HD domain-containing protein [Myxococcales bacterium]|nr:HD domain-containing protein [Myxococcales bacterium]
MSDRDALRRRLVHHLGLKELARAGWLRAGVAAPESVAAHSWGVAWLVLVLAPPSIDRGRALAIAVIHDLAEVDVGDVTPYDGVSQEEKRRQEEAAIEELVGGLPGGDELRALWLEYEDQSSPEGRFVKACDRLDMALQAQRYAAAQGVEVGDFIDSALAGLPAGLLRELAAP